MKLLVVDGNSIMNRAFYGIKTLTTADGRYTNAVYGFMNILLRQQSDCSPDRVAIAFDLPGGTFRNRMYEGYKANRHGMPEELAQQMPIIKELLEYLGYKIVTCPDYEADDILGTLSRCAVEQGMSCCILTGDRDSLQLVGNGTYVAYPSVRNGKSETEHMDEAAVERKMGVLPSQVIDLKALMGDSSDNVPGVSGIGEKTAVTLLKSFGTLEGVYENLEDPSIKPAVRKHLTEEKDMALLSRQLVTIDRNAPVDGNMDSYVLSERQEGKAYSLLVSLEMHSLVAKLDLKPGAASSVSVKAEPTELKPAREVTFSELPEGDACVLVEDTVLVMCGGCSCSVSSEQLGSLLQSGRKIITDDSKKLYRKVLETGAKPTEVFFDCRLAAYLLNPSASDYDIVNVAAEQGVVCEYSEVPESLGVMAKLAEALEEGLKTTEMLQLYREIELPLSLVLANMEQEGFLVDTDGIVKFGNELAVLAASEQEEVWKLAGHEFNLNSPKQLGAVLFEEMGLPSGKKTKNGYSTNADVLDSLRPFYPVVEHILNYRTYNKLNATYVDGLTRAADSTGRIHTEFRQTETRTGRISSVNPNLQNIPVRTQLGSNMRRFFIAGKGNVLLDADYSQIELRVLASVSRDNIMIETFKSGEDIHSRTACEIFDVMPIEVTSELRRRAKAVNFGIVYGMGAYTLSQDIGVSIAEAGRYINEYLASYPSVSAYLDACVDRAAKNGYVTTGYGRRRYIPELQNSNKQVQALGRRLAMNTPIQGTAADIIKIAMIRVFKRLSEELPDAKLILQVHDELIIECPEEQAERASHILREEMEGAASLEAGLVAEVHMGGNWYEAK